MICRHDLAPPIRPNAGADLDHERDLGRVLGGSNVAWLLRTELVLLLVDGDVVWHVCRVLESETDFGNERTLGGVFAVGNGEKGHGEGGRRDACESAERKKGLGVCQAQQVVLGGKHISRHFLSCPTLPSPASHCHPLSLSPHHHHHHLLLSNIPPDSPIPTNSPISESITSSPFIHLSALYLHLL